ncbi:MAG: CHAT domain-containing protein [Planctomycetota bacterium]
MQSQRRDHRRASANFARRIGMCGLVLAISAVGYAADPVTASTTAGKIALTECAIDRGQLGDAERFIDELRQLIRSDELAATAQLWLCEAKLLAAIAKLHVAPSTARARSISQLLTDARKLAVEAPCVTGAIDCELTRLALAEATDSTLDSDARYRAFERASESAQAALAPCLGTNHSHVADALTLHAELSLERGWLTEARSAAERALADSSTEFDWRVRRVRGRLAEAADNFQQALVEYETAIELVEAQRRALRAEPLGDGAWLAARLAPYQDAIFVAHRLGDDRRALRWVETARALWARNGADRDAATPAEWPPLPNDAQALVLFDTGRGLIEFLLRPGAALRATLVATSQLEIDRRLATLGRDTSIAECLATLGWFSERILAPLGLERKPVAAGERAPRLFIAPFGRLRAIPFDALHDGRSFLAEAYAVSQFASLAQAPWSTARAEWPPKANSILELANPELAPAVRSGARLAPLERGDDGLGLYLDGLASAGGTTPVVSRLVGVAASENSMVKISVGRTHVHIASHGDFDPLRPWQSAIYLAADADFDGRLTALELRQLNLRGCELITLSGCETGIASSVWADDLAGLTQAALAANAARVVGSLWPVTDHGAHVFMSEFHRVLVRSPPEEALRKAKMKLFAAASANGCYSSDDVVEASEPVATLLDGAAWVLLENGVRP